MQQNLKDMTSSKYEARSKYATKLKNAEKIDVPDKIELRSSKYGLKLKYEMLTMVLAESVLPTFTFGVRRKSSDLIDIPLEHFREPGSFVAVVAYNRFLAADFSFRSQPQKVS